MRIILASDPLSRVEDKVFEAHVVQKFVIFFQQEIKHIYLQVLFL